MPATLIVKPNEDIVHYALEGLIQAGHTLAVNIPLGVVSLIAQDASWPFPHMLASQQFTDSEMSLLLPLLNNHPDFCPYEELLASFDFHTITESNVERCRLKLNDALEEKQWDCIMRPVRNVLSRTRFKMRSFGIEIASILETGYTLLPAQKRIHR